MVRLHAGVWGCGGAELTLRKANKKALTDDQIITAYEGVGGSEHLRQTVHETTAASCGKSGEPTLEKVDRLCPPHGISLCGAKLLKALYRENVTCYYYTCKEVCFPGYLLRSCCNC